MEITLVICGTLCFLALTSALAFVTYAFQAERALEREDFLCELRRKVYLGKGASADEAANAVLIERTTLATAAAEAKRIAKSVPLSDTKAEPTIPGRLTIKMPDGRPMSLEKI
jgi:hypothetical protein